MSKKHLKRLNTPNTWDINKKIRTYIKRPLPGAHSFEERVALSIVVRDILGIAKTNKEVKNILQKNEILVDGKKRHEEKSIVGFMDSITFPMTKENFRITLNTRGKLDAIKIDEKEATQKISKINGKTMNKKGLHLNLSDGRNIFVEKTDAKVGDSVLIEIEKQNIKKVMKLTKGALIMLIGGKHIGKITEIEEIKENVMKCKNKDLTFETLKKYAFVIGEKKAAIKVEE